MRQEKTTRPFGISDKIGYLFGDLANDFTFLLSSTYLMKFYTDVMGVKPAVVGIIMTVARFVDAFTMLPWGASVTGGGRQRRGNSARGSGECADRWHRRRFLSIKAVLRGCLWELRLGTFSLHTFYGDRYSIPPLTSHTGPWPPRLLQIPVNVSLYPPSAVWAAYWPA